MRLPGRRWSRAVRHGVVHAVRILGYHRLHRPDLRLCDLLQLADGVDLTAHDLVHVKVHGRSLEPATPVPRPMQSLAVMQQHRNAAKQQGVDGALPSAGIADGLQAEGRRPVLLHDCIAELHMMLSHLPDARRQRQEVAHLGARTSAAPEQRSAQLVHLLDGRYLDGSVLRIECSRHQDGALWPPPPR